MWVYFGGYENKAMYYIYGSILVLHRSTKYDFKYYRKTEILKLRKILLFSYKKLQKTKKSRRIEPLTGRSSSKVLYNRVTMMVLT